MIVSSYLECALDPKQAKKKVAALVKLLKPLSGEFDSIAFCGSSGLLIGPTVAQRLNKQMILVRKEGANDNNHHSDYQVEGNSASQHYVIIDDLVCTGATIDFIKEKIENKFKTPTCRGIVLYGLPSIRGWD